VNQNAHALIEAAAAHAEAAEAPAATEAAAIAAAAAAADTAAAAATNAQTQRTHLDPGGPSFLDSEKGWGIAPRATALLHPSSNPSS